MTIIEFLTKSHIFAEHLLPSNLLLSYTFRQDKLAIHLTTEIDNEIHQLTHYEPVQSLAFLTPSAYVKILSDMETNLLEGIKCQRS
jgi:hypothetical protein